MFKKILIIASLFLCVSNLAYAKDKKITAYYFHGDIRCVTCNKIEKYTKEALDENFKYDKNILFKSVNTDEFANQHFLTDYELYTKSLVLVDEAGNWKNLDKIWILSGNEYELKNYIVNEVNKFSGV